MIELRKLHDKHCDDDLCLRHPEPSVAEVIEWLIEHEAVSVVSWCAAHDERWAGTKCFYGMRLQGQQIMPCRLEEPARHYVIGDVSDG